MQEDSCTVIKKLVVTVIARNANDVAIAFPVEQPFGTWRGNLQKYWQ